MAFSFNPGQISNTAAGQMGAPGAPITNQAPSVPDSPFLFMQHREGQAPSVNAYIQIVLLAIFVLSILSAATLFGYNMYLSSKVEAKKAEILSKEASFKEYPYVEMKKFYTRMTSLNMLMKEYASVRSSFRLLEKVVENKVTFTEFGFQKEKDGTYSLKLIAETNNYRVLVQQLDALSLSQYAKVVPNQKVDKVQEKVDKGKQLITVEVVAPAAFQGLLPEDIQFDDAVVVVPQAETAAQ